MRIESFFVLWTWLVLMAIANAQTLPYNPTTILLPSSPSQTDDIAFVFLVSSESDTRPEFLFLNISGTILASDLVVDPFTPNLPFLDNNTAFLPTIGAYGDISLLTGSCSTSSSTELWTFIPEDGVAWNGTWVKQKTNVASAVSSARVAGAEFLSGGFQFSTLVNANATYTDIYMYGGMCPRSSANISTWQAKADYSNHMLRLSPGLEGSYNLDFATNRAAPIAEAGFTATALRPSYSNTSGIMTQAQNVILLGGHTRNAFINMSQVAIWSLPEESWSFVTIDPPSSAGGSNTELQVKSSVTTVDSRSGHTAVLTEDGSKVIVLGGWVGNVHQAADPQLAVLELGTGYGGSGDWEWSVPADQPPGNGLYGHGAVMLPGNVMMVLGGFNITASSNTKRALTTSIQTMFFNVTSSTWSSNYTNPAHVTAASRGSNPSSNSLKFKIGLGIGIGIAALIFVIIGVGWCLVRRRKRRESRREARESDLRSLSYNAANAYIGAQEMSQARDYSDRHEQYYDSGSAAGGYESLHTGEYSQGEVGSPTLRPRQIPRLWRNARGLYQPALTFDPSRVAGNARATSFGTAGPIHPIYEDDEDDMISPIEVGNALPLGDSDTYCDSKQRTDPFNDPVPQSLNFSTTGPRKNRSATNPLLDSPTLEIEREIESWVADWAAADALLHAQARSHSTVRRTSPSRRANFITATGPASVSGEISDDTGRTTSNISERSMDPSAATLSRSGSGSQGARSNSLRDYLTYAINAITSGNATFSSTPDIPNAQGQPPGSSGSEQTASTFATAHTHSSFSALQAEGVNLLPRPEEFTDQGRPSLTISPASPPRTPTRTTTESAGSPSKNKPTSLGRRGWLGSLRRAFSPEGATAAEANLVDPGPSPILIGVDTAPRRTVSAGATLWRRKQGREDWEDSEKVGAQRGRSNSLRNGTQPKIRDANAGRELAHAIDEDEEWDIERAIEDRVVQVMFTVPREKLRVVNHDVREDMSEGGSLGGRSRVASASGSATLSRRPSEILNTGDGANLARTGSVESGGSKKRVKGKGKVSELVEMLEDRNSPHRR
ncbi:hypothetical protein DSL72_001914 [Monilinia vaccinii-corymbosi]|uniref:Galactose oxidase n=1 Tax=Monilinia vaccinii-corymbosi TaxID=61207 RepID=A0A8A3PB56_9HELO|nr:hypothetical protein DSL72_001914 [Monilinia vaccinii-corymbosi]